MNKINNNTQFDSKETPYTLQRKINVEHEVIARCTDFLNNPQNWQPGQKKELQGITGSLSTEAVQNTLKRSSQEAQKLFQKLQRLTSS